MTLSLCGCSIASSNVSVAQSLANNAQSQTNNAQSHANNAQSYATIADLRTANLIANIASYTEIFPHVAFPKAYIDYLVSYI